VADEAEKDDTLFTGEDLAKIVSVSDEVRNLDRDGDSLDDGDAEAILSARMNGARDIAELIVDALPSNARTAITLASLDLRPYLKAIDGKMIVTRDDVPWYLGGSSTANRRASTIDLLERESERLVTNGGSSSFDDEVADVNPISATTTASAAPVDPETGEPLPVVDPVTGLLGETGLTDLATAQNEQRPVTVNDLIEMINTDQWDLETAMANEAETGLSIPIDFGMTQADLDPGTAARDRSGRPAPPHSRKVKDKPLTTQQALGYLQSLPPSKISDMQQKLANAGYYDELDNGGNYMPGDAHDPNTIRAMRAMITDTIQSGQSMPKLLGERMKSYRENAKAARMKQVMKMDPTYNRALANDFGQSVLGRNLRGDEIDELTNHLKTVIAKRAGFVSGADNNPGDGPLPDVRGYTDDDVDLHLGDKYNLGVEQRQNTQREMAYLLGKLAK
jgi:hypothetical protein